MKSDNVIAKGGRARSLLLYAIFQTLVLIAFYFPWLNGSCSIFHLDGTHFVEPLAKFVGESIRRLDFPLWNPLNYCGMPQTAIPLQGICYPFTWIFSILPFNCTLALSMIFHQLLLGIGAFLLLSSYELGTAAALLAAISFAMSGYAFSMCTEFQIIQSAAWCPLSAWGMRLIELKISDRNKKCSWEVLISSVFVALQILAGSPDISMVQIALLTLLILHSYVRRRKDNPLAAQQTLLTQVRSLFFGFMLATPMLLPTAEWLAQSRRQSGLSVNETLTLSANWYDLLGVILPQPLGNLQLRYSEFRNLVMQGQMLPYVGSCFLGPVLISAAIWSLFDKNWKSKTLLAMLLVLLGFLALGQNTIVMPAVLSIINLPIRFPVKHMFFFVGFLAVFAAKGIDDTLSGFRPFLAAAAVWLVLIISGLLLSSNVPILPYAYLNFAPDAVALANSQMSKSCLIYGIGGLVLNLLGIAFVWRKLSLKCFKICVLVSASLSLFLYPFMHRAEQSADGNYFQKSSAVAQMIEKYLARTAANKKDEYRVLGLYLEHFTIPNTVLDENNPEHDNLKATINAYQYSRQILRPNTNMDFGLLSSFGFEASCTGDYFNFLQNCYAKSSQARGISSTQADDEPIAKLCLATATRFILTQSTRFSETPSQLELVPMLDSRYFQLINEDRRLNIRLYELKSVAPRAYFCSNLRRAASHDEALSMMFEAGKNRFEPIAQPIIELDTATSAQKLPSKSSENISQIVSSSNNTVLVTVNSEQAGYLVLSDQYYEGWNAAIDGVTTPIYRANSFFRAVSLLPGKHEVRFTFVPKPFYAGLLIALISLIYLIANAILAKSVSKQEGSS